MLVSKIRLKLDAEENEALTRSRQPFLVPAFFGLGMSRTP
jgi:hypothetical protein